MSTQPSDFEHEEASQLHHQKRRMSDHKIQAIAESAYLKVFQFIFTAITLPFFAWFGMSVLDEMKDLKRQFGIYSIDKATIELRINSAEKQLAELNVQSRVISEEVLRLKIEQQSGRDRNQQALRP